jgi:hypothetical protein
MSNRSTVGPLVLALAALWTAPLSPAHGHAALGQDAFSPAATRPAFRPDFNGDKFADLAVGIPNEDLAPFGLEGAVGVIYGANGGLSSAGNQFWSQNSAGILDEGDNGDHFGTAVAFGNFNGDDFDDLAVGVPNEGFSGVGSNVGGVNVIYGSAAGLTSAGNQFWTQDSPGVLDEGNENDRLGDALVSGDFNGDGFSDLAIGAPGERTPKDAGAVTVLYGSAAGLTSVGNQFWRQLQDSPEKTDQFGDALAAGDFNDDGFADLVVGVPGEDVAGQATAGAVNVIYGSAAGLTAAGNQFWTQNSPGVLDKAGSFDQFGHSLSAGDFDGDGFGDLAVGALFDNVGTIESAGLVNVLYGSAAGLSAAGDQVWTQDATGVLDQAEPFDLFGADVVAADFDDDGFTDLAIGAHGEDLEGVGGVVPDAGEVNVIYGSATGLTAAGNQIWNQNSAGILDVAEQSDRLGFTLSRGDFNGDKIADLVVGVFGEDVGTGGEAGAVNIIPGSPGGVTSTGNQFWSQESPGILDAAEVSDRFGYTLTAR